MEWRRWQKRRSIWFTQKIYTSTKGQDSFPLPLTFLRFPPLDFGLLFFLPGKRVQIFGRIQGWFGGDVHRRLSNSWGFLEERKVSFISRNELFVTHRFWYYQSCREVHDSVQSLSVSRRLMGRVEVASQTTNLDPPLRCRLL